MGRRRRGSSASSATRGDIPPWVLDRAQVKLDVTVDVADRIHALAERLNVTKSYLVDALFRSIDDAEIVELIQDRKVADGEDRAWSQGG